MRYVIIATEDFVNVIKELPLRNVNVLTQSFVSIQPCTNQVDEGESESTFVRDLLEQLKNQEVE